MCLPCWSSALSFCDVIFCARCGSRYSCTVSFCAQCTPVVVRCGFSALVAVCGGGCIVRLAGFILLAICPRRISLRGACVVLRCYIVCAMCPRYSLLRGTVFFTLCGTVIRAVYLHRNALRLCFVGPVRGGDSHNVFFRWDSLCVFCVVPLRASILCACGLSIFGSWAVNSLCSPLRGTHVSALIFRYWIDRYSIQFAMCYVNRCSNLWGVHKGHTEDYYRPWEQLVFCQPFAPPFRRES